METWDKKEDSLLFCYPVTEFPVWPGWLPWSLLWRDTNSETDSDQSAVIERQKPSQYPALYSSPVIYSLTAAHDIFTLCHTLLSHSQSFQSTLCLSVCGVWLPSAGMLLTLHLVDNSKKTPKRIDKGSRKHFLHAYRSFFYDEKTQAEWQKTEIESDNERQEKNLQRLKNLRQPWRETKQRHSWTKQKLRQQKAKMFLKVHFLLKQWRAKDFQL